MVLHIGKYFGIAPTLAKGSDGKRYLCAIVWYPRSRTRLGYWYPSIRWF